MTKQILVSITALIVLALCAALAGCLLGYDIEEMREKARGKQKQEQTVTFNKNNSDSGSTEANPQTKTVTTPATTIDALPAPPARTGYAFVGWNTQADGAGTAFTASTTVTEDITVYASWTEEVPEYFDVYFDSNGGSSVPSQNVLKGALAEEPEGVTRQGFVIEGWYKEADLTNRWDFDSETVTGNIVLYAKWSGVPEGHFVITFVSNGGNSVNPQIIALNGYINEPVSPVRTGYVFDQWYADALFATYFDYAIQVTSDRTAYANWTPITYTVRYDKNDAGATGNTTDSSHTYDTEKALSINGYSLTGSSFVGWSKTPDGDVDFKEGENVKNLSSTAGAVVTLYARWGYVISFAQISDAAPLIAGPVISRSGANGPVTATVTVENPSQFTSIDWHIPGTNIKGSGASFSLDSANTAYNNTGEHFLTLEVIKDGVPYSRAITFTVAP